jgi:hypothetical protein
MADASQWVVIWLGITFFLCWFITPAKSKP